MEGIYTFEQIKEKYNWTTSTRPVDYQIKYAKCRGVLLEFVYKKRTNYFKILKEFPVYTIDDLVKKYNASEYIKVAPLEERKNYFKTRGVILEIIGKRESTNIYQILEDNFNQTYTWEDLCNKYPYLDKNIQSCQRESLALKKGLLIKQSGVSNRTSYYTVLKGDNYQWDSFKEYPELEFCKEGYIRNKKTKRVYNGHNAYGYIYLKYKENLYLAHRLLMLIYNPIENPDDYVVDHINGKRDDNRLENLRWVTIKENLQFRDENRQKLQEKVNECLQLVGYDILIEEMDNLLKKLKK